MSTNKRTDNDNMNELVNMQNKLEIGFNALNNNKFIIIPPAYPKRKNISAINGNKILYNKIKNKLELNQDDVYRINNTGNGKYFFKLLVNFL